MSRQEAKLVVTAAMVWIGILGVLNLDLLRNLKGYVTKKASKTAPPTDIAQAIGNAPYSGSDPARA